MAYCAACGSVLAGEAKFCSHCGAALQQSPPQPAQAPTKASATNNTSAGCIGCAGTLAAFIALAFIIGTCSGGASSSTASSSDASSSDSVPEPTLTPIPVAIQKKSFIEGADESISGGMIAGNKLKYIGKDVDLHCTVLSIVDDSSFNAECGEDSDGDPAIILVHYQYTSSLDKGQSVRVLGTVAEPTEGVNGYGGESTFPTVDAQFME